MVTEVSRPLISYTTERPAVVFIDLEDHFILVVLTKTENVSLPGGEVPGVPPCQLREGRGRDRGDSEPGQDGVGGSQADPGDLGH